MKRRKRVEYRWFVATPDLGLVGGIHAATADEAAQWGALERWGRDDGAKLVRVRLEYVAPKRAGKSGGTVE